MKGNEKALFVTCEISQQREYFISFAHYTENEPNSIDPFCSRQKGEGTSTKFLSLHANTSVLPSLVSYQARGMRHPVRNEVTNDGTLA